MGSKFSMPLEQSLGAMLLSFAFSPLHITSLTCTNDYLPEKGPTQLNVYILIQKRCLLTTFHGPHILPMAFTGCHDPGSNLQPSNERAGSLTPQPILLA